MIALRINNTFLDLTPRTAVSFTLVNPIFDQANASRMYTYPFRIEATDRNVQALGYTNRLDVRSRTHVYENAEIYIEGELFEVGRAKVTGGTEDTIELVFQRTELQVLDDIKKIKIRDILETATWAGGATAQWIFNITCGAPNNYYIVIGGVPFDYAAGAGETDADIVQGLSALIDAEYAGMTFSPPGETQLRIDSDKLVEYGVSIDTGSLVCLELDSVTTLSEGRQDAFLAHVTATNQGAPDKYAFPTVRWFGFYEGANPEFNSYVNLWIGGAAAANTPSTEMEWNYTYIPFVFLHYVFTRILTQLDNLDSFAGTFYESTDIQELLLYNNRAVDELQLETYQDGLQKYLNRFQTSIDLNQHVPDMTAYELVTAFMQSFALHFRTENRQFIFRRNVDQIRRPPVDWTDKAEPQYESELSGDDGFVISYADQGDDVYTDPGQLQDYTVAPGDTDVELPFSALHVANQSSDQFATTIKVPIVNSPGSSDEAGLGENEYPLRFFFYRGLQLDSAGNDYPFGTHDATNRAGDSVGELSLALDTDKGLYEQCFEGYVELLNAPTVTKLMRLGVEDLLEIRKWENSRRKIYHQQGEMTAVIKSVQFKVSGKGVSVAKIEFLQQT